MRPIALPTVLVLALACAPAPRGAGRDFDPVRAEPSAIDATHPASIEDLVVPSGGVYPNGIVYVAAGAGPHPVVILLHGYPGHERNGDLAHALRRAGWTVLFFHYRGTWGSPGDFSLGNAIADVEAALALVRTRGFARRYRADSERVALVGHSMGGFLALAVGAQDPGVRCVASLAGANLGVFGAAAAADPKLRARLVGAFDAWSGPVHGASGDVLVGELVENAARWDTTRGAGDYAGRAVLLVAGERDQVTPPAQHHDPLVAAFTAAGAGGVEPVALDADHAFSGRRLALADTVVGWLDRACR